MTEQTMDEAAKERVKATLVERARAELAALLETVQEDDSASQLDQDDSFSVDDQSQADEAGDLSGLFQRQREQRQEDVERIEQLDVSPKSSVEPGAIVGFDGSRYLVGVVAVDFDCDGVTYQGISADSPIFEVLEGVALGDTFTFRERTHTIDFLA